VLGAVAVGLACIQHARLRPTNPVTLAVATVCSRYNNTVDGTSSAYRASILVHSNANLSVRSCAGMLWHSIAAKKTRPVCEGSFTTSGRVRGIFTWRDSCGDVYRGTRLGGCDSPSHTRHQAPLTASSAGMEPRPDSFQICNGDGIPAKRSALIQLAVLAPHRCIN
jgi:hypothetical protein